MDESTIPVFIFILFIIFMAIVNRAAHRVSVVASTTGGLTDGSRDPVFVSISHKPRAVVKMLDGLVSRHADQEALLRGRRVIPRLLFLAGLALVVVDLTLGYASRLFIVAAVGIWIIAFAMSRALRRAQPGSGFGPHFQTGRDVIHTLRDDVHPKRNLFGHLDLTGIEQPSKLAREAPNVLGLAVAHYRDEWLNLKARLYDGNMLRLSAVRRFKVRKGYYKRGRISGKQKWKPPKTKGDHQELSVRISVNPETYEISGLNAPRAGDRVGAFRIGRVDTGGGIISLSAIASVSSASAADILGVLQSAYKTLQRKASA